ncbi:MAG TPA: hypothetical protein VJQ83_05025 [Tepidiformaceae bacterium]|nr:hypothetical protein [Tepidiformaceae bacterium]
MTRSEADIQALIRRYLNGDCSLDQFRDDFVHLTPMFDWDPDTPIGDLLGTVELLFAESSGGYLSEPDFRDGIRQAAAVRTA